MTIKQCDKCGRLVSQTKPHICPPKNWNKEFLNTLTTKTSKCKKCGRLIGKKREHICPDAPWNKGKVGVQKAWNKGQKSTMETRKKLSETRKRLYKEGKLKKLIGKDNPMFGKVPKTKGIKTGKPSWISGRKMPLEIRLKNAGPNHYNWKGGESSVNKQIRKSYEYRNWVKEILIRDNYTCWDCCQRGGKLEVHHIKPFALLVHEYKITSLVKALLCVPLWDKSNAQTLCKTCHKKTPTFLKNPKKCYNVK